jgi:hypothetical protein
VKSGSTFPAFVAYSARGIWPPLEGDSQVARWHDLQPIIYVVAEADSAKAIRIVGTEVQINADIEPLCRVDKLWHCATSLVASSSGLISPGEVGRDQDHTALFKAKATTSGDHYMARTMRQGIKTITMASVPEDPAPAPVTQRKPADGGRISPPGGSANESLVCDLGSCGKSGTGDQERASYPSGRGV